MAGLCEKIAKMKSFKARVPAEKEQILEAELSLGLSFAKEYKEYLAKYGCVAIYGHEFTGICSSKRLSVVGITQKNRGIDEETPKDWYVIEELNIDGLVVWQDSSGVVYIKSPTSKAQKICNSFCEYINL